MGNFQDAVTTGIAVAQNFLYFMHFFFVENLAKLYVPPSHWRVGAPRLVVKNSIDSSC